MFIVRLYYICDYQENKSLACVLCTIKCKLKMSYVTYNIYKFIFTRVKQNMYYKIRAHYSIGICLCNDRAHICMYNFINRPHASLAKILLQARRAQRICLHTTIAYEPHVVDVNISSAQHNYLFLYVAPHRPFLAK